MSDHFEQGKQAFLDGAMRVVPQSLLVDEGADAAREWYRGWDAENLAQPVPGLTDEQEEGRAVVTLENKTGIEVGDHVEVHGGFEDGLRGQVVEVDLSGTVKPYPRFAIYTDGGHKRVGGIIAGNLTKFAPEADWTEESRNDGNRSWIATMSAPEGTQCQLRIIMLNESEPASFSWRVVRVNDSEASLVDAGHGLNLQNAQQHAVRAVVWHGDRKES